MVSRIRGYAGFAASAPKIRFMAVAPLVRAALISCRYTVSVTDVLL
jgi:hypothetical protein